MLFRLGFFGATRQAKADRTGIGGWSIMKRYPQQQQNARVRRSRDVIALSRLALLLFCGLVLTCGFVLAAQRHFEGVQYGYKTESLRAERKKLIEDNQRLALEKETISAPSRLEPAARKLGLQPAKAAQIAPADSRDRSISAEEVNQNKTNAKENVGR
jgi:cell division protein FtsL